MDAQWMFFKGAFDGKFQKKSFFFVDGIDFFCDLVNTLLEIYSFWRISNLLFVCRPTNF
jgi:hypothetical protein